MNKKTSFVQGAAILGIAGLIVKVIGALYRIPLTHIISTEGMGLYQMAYPIYSTLLVVSTAGLPTAISKMVSEHVAVGDYRGAHQVFQTAFKILLLLGIISTLALFLFAAPLAEFLGNAKSAPAFQAIAPALFFVAVLSAYRGYFQGLQMMTPTAVSQIVEQLGKLLVGFSLAYILFPSGVEYAAAGALMGVTISEVIALALLIGMYNRRKANIKHAIRHSPRTGKRRFGALAARLANVAIPVTIGASIMPLTGVADTAIVINRLTLLPQFDTDTATKAFGVLTGGINPLINMPAVLTVALSMSLVPAVSAAKAAGQVKLMRSHASNGLRLAMMIGMPAAVGMYLLAEPILRMLYSSYTPNELALGVQMLQIMSAGVLFLSMVQTVTGVLQGTGKVYLPVVNLAIGALAKVIINIILVGNEQVNILGAPIGTLVCYAISGILNVICMVRVTGMRFSIIQQVLLPGISSAVMGVAVWGIRNYIPIGSNAISLILCVAAGGMVYLGMLLISGGLRPADAQMLPGGQRIVALVQRFGLWKT